MLRLVASRSEQPADRAGPVPQPEDGPAAPEQHLRQDRGDLADRRCRVRLRARAGLIESVAPVAVLWPMPAGSRWYRTTRQGCYHLEPATPRLWCAGPGGVAPGGPDASPGEPLRMPVSPGSPPAVEPHFATGQRVSAQTVGTPYGHEHLRPQADRPPQPPPGCDVRRLSAAGTGSAGAAQAAAEPRTTPSGTGWSPPPGPPEHLPRRLYRSQLPAHAAPAQGCRGSSALQWLARAGRARRRCPAPGRRVAQPDAEARAPQGGSSQVLDEIQVGAPDPEGDHHVVGGEQRPDVRNRAHEVPEPLWVMPRGSTRSVPLHCVPATSRVGPPGDPVREVARIRRLALHVVSTDLPTWLEACGHEPPRRLPTCCGWPRPRATFQQPRSGASPVTPAPSVVPRHAHDTPERHPGATASEPLTCANALPPPGFSELLASHVTTGQDSHNI